MSLARKIAKAQAAKAQKAAPQMQQLLAQLSSLAPELEGMGVALQSLQGLQAVMEELQASVTAAHQENERLRWIITRFVGDDTMKRLEAEFDATRTEG